MVDPSMLKAFPYGWRNRIIPIKNGLEIERFCSNFWPVGW